MTIRESFRGFGKVSESLGEFGRVWENLGELWGYWESLRGFGRVLGEFDMSISVILVHFGPFRSFRSISVHFGN